MKIVSPSVVLVHATPDPERIIEQMGRICYQSQHKAKLCGWCHGSGKLAFPEQCGSCSGTGTNIESAIAFVRMIRERGHESVLEHVSAGFRIVTDRGVTHELVRHRIASFAQESTRYCDYSNDRFGCELSFIEPPGLDTIAKSSSWTEGVMSAEKCYLELRKKDVPAQIARSVLPNSLKSEIAMTANAREWRHFLKLRTSKAAHPQMREVAGMISKLLREWSPVLFEDIVTEE